MSQEKRQCARCGAELMQSATFCSHCGSPVTVAGAAATPGYSQTPPTTPPQRYEKGEKHQTREKREKQEKQEKEKGRGGELGGALIGGGVLIWLGLLVYLEQTGTILAEDFGGYFLIGIGILLVLSGVVRRTRAGYPLTGLIIGGVILVLLGVASFPTLRNQLALNNLIGPLILVFLGLIVIMAGVSARRRSPPP